jgi:hypothetical protein
MILHVYTIFHTLISLVAIFTGFVVLLGLLDSKRFDSWTEWFLIPALKAIAPTQTEPPFQITQLIALALFVGLTTIGVVRFRIAPARSAAIGR